jgi:hypothetical protein
MQENRAFPRVSADCRLKFRPVGDDPMFREMSASDGLMQNISGGGISMIVDEDPGLGGMLALDIDLPGFPTSVIALGKVVWSKPAGRAFDVGVEFWWIGWRDEAAQAQIRAFIARKLRDDVEAQATDARRRS